jgi:putative CRISPR-associated protein (TIGR02619 family)
MQPSKHKPLLIISTGGISLLTNILRQEKVDGLDQKTLFQLSNKVSEEDIPHATLAPMSELLTVARQRLLTMDIEEVAKASAEVNSLSRVDGALSQQALHYFVTTDTYLGRQTAELLAAWLEERGESVQIKTIKGLTTRDSTSFMDGAKNLLQFLTGVVRAYRQSHYVIFNLTGGFKSLLGLMTTIGCFYADEVVYVFESGDDLIRIPRLPIKLDDQLFKAHATELLRMSADDFISLKEAENIPPALLENVDEQHVGLSVWGALIWDQYSSELLAQELVALPYLQYESSFRKDFDKLQKEDKIKLQQTLARVAGYLKHTNGSREALLGNRAGGIKYEQYSGKNSRYGHFRYGGGDRVSCEPGTGKLVLRHCGEHDYVNNNP